MTITAALAAAGCHQAESCAPTGADGASAGSDAGGPAPDAGPPATDSLTDGANVDGSLSPPSDAQTGGEVSAAAGCGCPAGDYFIEVKAEALPPTSRTFRFTFDQRPLNPTCVPTAPWAFYSARSGQFGLYGCDSADQTRNCLRLDPGDPGIGFALWDSGIRETVVHPAIVVDNKPAKPFNGGVPWIARGSYTATAVDEQGNAVSLRGTFQVCASALEAGAGP